MESLVTIENVSKIYPRVHKSHERLKAFVSLLFGREPGQGAQVLQDINLDVLRGQSVGIIGQNGAGKSTLHSRTKPPSSESVRPSSPRTRVVPRSSLHPRP